MPTTTLTAAADTFDLWIGLQGGANGAALTSQNGYVIDAAGGVDQLIIHDSYGSGNFTLVADSNGLMTLTTGSGNVKFQNFESIKFGTTVIALGTSGADTITGAAKNDKFLYGLGGSDTIDGGAGLDTMYGGLGDDTYIVDNAGDVVVENLTEGTDTVKSSVTYTLAANVENLTLTGTAAINGTGNALANTITGNSAINLITAGGGNDIIDGAGGNDTLILTGAKADYVFTVIDAAHTSIADGRLNGDGTDAVTSVESIKFTDGTFLLTDLLNAGGGGQTFNGTAASETLTGGTGTDTLNGFAGNDILKGGAGADTMNGGLGNDTYEVDDAGDIVNELPAQGTDTVLSALSYALGANVENLTLTGTTALNGTGNALANKITGNTAANIIDGGLGADAMLGGDGGDTYVVDNAKDVITELLNQGKDAVQSSLTYKLGLNVEDLTLTGSAIINGTGNTLANSITGNDVANIIDGGAGADTLKGGKGDDTYIVDNAGDTVSENFNEGTDTVKSSVAFVLGTDIENLTLTGAAAVNGTGNDLVNTIIGNTGANVIDGGLGADILKGGTGNDTYIVDNAGDVVTELAGQGTDTVVVNFSYVLGATLENVTLTGSANLDATGNALANVLTGNSGANKLTGGLGNDTYVVDNAGDVVVELAKQGTDTVQSSISYALGSDLENLTLIGTGAVNATGNALVNKLVGNAGANTLDGGLGADVMAGGDGSDIYVVENLKDTVTELLNQGTDTVLSGLTYKLGLNVEDLTLTGSAIINGTGNTLANAITGNSVANIIDGGAGADTLKGGAGDDTYIVDNAGDTVSENFNDGTDTVKSSVTFVLGTDIENLTLTGAAAVNGTGNDLVNTIIGNTGANLLDGGLGADIFKGGAGNDTYIVDNAGDVVTELAAQGTDTVQSSLSYALGLNVENLTLTGSGAIDATGNKLANTLIGNAMANVITGGGGKDVMSGGGGSDTFVFAAAAESLKGATHDIITDFAVGQDHMDLSAIDANSKVLLDQQFNFLAGAGTAFTGAAGDLHFYLDKLGNTIIEGDTNGDKLADFQIQLNGAVTLSGSDFVL